MPFNSLLGFSSFESNKEVRERDERKIKLSIPYWDFLVLNRASFSLGEKIYVLTFNSLLGFSSFESDIIYNGGKSKNLYFQFPIGIF